MAVGASTAPAGDPAGCAIAAPTASIDPPRNAADRAKNGGVAPPPMQDRAGPTFSPTRWASVALPAPSAPRPASRPGRGRVSSSWSNPSLPFPAKLPVVHPAHAPGTIFAPGGPRGAPPHSNTFEILSSQSLSRPWHALSARAPGRIARYIRSLRRRTPCLHTAGRGPALEKPCHESRSSASRPSTLTSSSGERQSIPRNTLCQWPRGVS